MTGFGLTSAWRKRGGLIFFFALLLVGLPVMLVGLPADAAQVTLAWDRNAESNVAGYKIYYGTGSRVYNWFIDVGNATSHTVTGLADGSTYYFAATAYDTSNMESTYSGEVTYNSCSFSLSPTSVSLGQQGGTGNVAVSTQPGCPWTASSGAPWLIITAGSQGTGSGTVSYSVASNTSSGSRTVASTIAGRVFTVSQAGTGTTYTITSSAGTGGTISPAGTVVLSQGTSRTFTITANTGYRISDVRVNGSSVGAVTTYAFTNIQANQTIAASFTLSSAPTSTYTITASAGAGGTISPSGSIVLSKGTSRTFTITPNAGYKVSTVYVDGSWKGAKTSYTFSNVVANHTIKAVFTPQTYTITASAGTGGTISPSGSVSVAHGTAKYFSISPKTGYKISRVLVDGVSVGAVTSYRFNTVTSSHTIAASFVSR